MLLLCLMKVNRFRITRSFEKLRMNVPLAWVIWIALTIQAYSASPCLDTQLGVTKPVQHHKLCDNLDENLEFLLIRVQIVSCPVIDSKMHGLTVDQKSTIKAIYKLESAANTIV